jgi:hypothetical protein
MLHFDAFANKLLSTVRLKYFNAYVHIDVVVKSSGLSALSCFRHPLNIHDPLHYAN